MGEYRLASALDIEMEAAFDPAFLETLVPASVRVTLVGGEKKIQNLRGRARE